MSTLVSFSGRDMEKEPFTVGELVEILKEFPQDHDLRFIGMNGELFFVRFKQRGEKLQTIEFSEHDS